MEYIIGFCGFFLFFFITSGTEFNNSITKEVFKLEGIQQNMSNTYHPQTNGDYLAIIQILLFLINLLIQTWIKMCRNLNIFYSSIHTA